jgi:hypothetical protein
MLLFGSIAPGGGNTGTNFWQFSQSANPLIDVDKTTGATGIYATTPSEMAYNILSDNVSGINDKGAGNLIQDNNQFAGVAAIDERANGGELYSIMAGTNGQKTGFLQVYTQNVQQVRIGLLDYATNSYSLRTQDEQSIGEEVSDNNLNATQHNQNSNAQSFYFFNPTSGAAKATYQFDDIESQVKDGAGVKTFSVLKNGEIQTNQAIPHDNTINTLTWNMPLYDTTGTLLGYLKIFNK